MKRERIEHLRTCVKVKVWDDPDARVAVAECLDEIERLRTLMQLQGHRYPECYDMECICDIEELLEDNKLPLFDTGPRF
jgi:DNA segregation ATPase FtsK/SpoIIIE-like protein